MQNKIVTLIAGRLMARHFIRARKPPHGNILRMKKLPERRFKIPFGAQNAAKKIQAKRIVFGKSVASDVRFGEQTKAGDAAGSRKLMPLRLAHGSQLHATDHSVKESFHGAQIPQGLR
jgi:hypothetical protein